MAVLHHPHWTTTDPSASLSPSDRQLLWWQRLVLTDTMRAFLFLWIFVLLMLHVVSGGQRDDPSVTANKDSSSSSVPTLTTCSRLCQCEANAVDCSNRGLTQVPLDLPKDADKMWVYFIFVSFPKNWVETLCCAWLMREKIVFMHTLIRLWWMNYSAPRPIKAEEAKGKTKNSLVVHV